MGFCLTELGVEAGATWRLEATANLLAMEGDRLLLSLILDHTEDVPQ
jgi:hypothetical protein